MFLYTLGISLLIVGIGLSIRWLWEKRHIADRLGYSVLAVLLLGYWLVPFGSGERLLGLADLLAIDQIRPDFGSMFVFIVATITSVTLLFIYNGEILIAGTIFTIGRIRSLAPVMRTSMAYPLHFKSRTGLTTVMFALVIFIMVVIEMLMSTIQQNTQINRLNGGWQIQTDSPGLPPDLIPQVRSNARLSHEITTIGWQDVELGQMQAFVPNRPVYRIEGLLRACDDTFLSNETIPMQARAAGYSSDQDVWNAVKNQTGLAVLHDPLGASPTSTVQGIASGFQPFELQLTDSQHPEAIHRVKIIGILPTIFQWPVLFMSTRTGSQVFTDPRMVPKWYLFRLRAGVSEQQVERDLGETFGARYGMQPELISDKVNHELSFLHNLTAFLVGYLALGLLIGICGLGIISSMAVVERRQQIGMLRALGYSRILVLSSFLLEAGFVTLLGLVTGTGLGILATYRITGILLLNTDTIAIPFATIGLSLLAATLVVLLTTVLPAHSASRVLPAEALRTL